jgi:TatD DNase family protein
MMTSALVDIGANLTHPAFDRDRDAVVEAAARAGVSPLILTGTNVAESRAARDYAARMPGRIYATAGVHPHDAKTCGESTLEALKELARDPLVRAIGECGLDYDRDFSPRPVQREWFEKQLALAMELQMPLFLHVRDAFEDFAAALEACQKACRACPGTAPRMVVHCFTGTEAELDRCLDLGCHIGITGWICDERRGGHLGPLLKKIPPDRLMIETDAPFLLPRDLGEKVRSGRNEPKYLPHIAARVAGYLGKDAAQVAAETRQTSLRFFGLD